MTNISYTHIILSKKVRIIGIRGIIHNSHHSVMPGWLMEQPSLFQTAGVYAGDMELVLSIELEYIFAVK